MLQWVRSTLSPRTQNLLSISLPKPHPSAQIARRMDASCMQPWGTPCTSQSINPVVICCQVVPALMPYANQLQKTKHPRILVDGNVCRNAFLCFLSVMIKGPVLAGAGTEALGCSSSWAGGLPCTERPPCFLHCSYRDQRQMRKTCGLPSTIFAGRGLEKLLAPPPLSLTLSVPSVVPPTPSLGSRLLL